MKNAKYYYNPRLDTSADFDMLVAEAKEVIFPLTEEKFEGWIAGVGYYPITESKAKEFYRDLRGNGATTGIMFTKEIARKLDITETKANAYLYACADFGITERQGGAWVI